MNAVNSASSNSHRNNNNTAKYRVTSFDEISLMVDEELSRRISSLNGYIEREKRRGNQHNELEVEHSYFAREVQIRINRKAAHEEWLKTHGNEFEELYE